jgi:hypothetical protein
MNRFPKQEVKYYLEGNVFVSHLFNQGRAFSQSSKAQNLLLGCLASTETPPSVPSRGLKVLKVLSRNLRHDNAEIFSTISFDLQWNVNHQPSRIHSSALQ